MNALMTMAALGFDSFLASLLIGALGASRREMLVCAVAFGICDSAATWAGSRWPIQLPQTVTLCLYLLCPLALPCTVHTKRVLLFALPVALGLDNLVTKTPGALAPLLGASSTAMSLLGSSAAALMRNRWFATRWAH